MYSDAIKLELEQKFQEKERISDIERKKLALPGKTKKNKQLFSDAVRKELVKKFKENNQIFGNERKKLAEKLNLTEEQIKTWFFIRRRKLGQTTNKDYFFSDEVRKELVKKFKENIYILGNEKKKLAEKLNLTETQVKKWFLRRRWKLGQTKSRAFSDAVVKELNRKFQEDNHISGNEKKKLAEKLNLTEDQIMYWFCNRRRKFVKTKRPSNLYKKMPVLSVRSLESTDTSTRGKPAKKLGSKLQIKIWFEKRCSKLRRPYGRRVFSDSVIKELKQVFQENNRISDIESIKLAKKLKLTEKQVRKWFEIMRSKCGKTNSKFSCAVRKELDRKFQESNHILGNEKKKLARKLNLTEQQVKSWFCKRRALLGKTNSKKFSVAVIRELKQKFQENNHISGIERKKLAMKLNLTERQVRDWFVRRRGILGKTKNYQYFSDAVRKELERKFQENRYILGIRRKWLAEKLNLTEEQVRGWFKHNRTKLLKKEISSKFQKAIPVISVRLLDPKDISTPAAVTSSTNLPNDNKTDNIHMKELKEKKRKNIKLEKPNQDLMLSNAKKSEEIARLNIKLEAKLDDYKRKTADRNEDLAPLNDPTSDKQVANTKKTQNNLKSELKVELKVERTKNTQEYKEVLPMKVKQPESNEQNTGHIYLGQLLFSNLVFK